MHTAPFPHSIPTNRHLVLPRIPSLVTAVLNRASDQIWEMRLGIRTTGSREIGYRDAERYQPLPYHAIERVLDRLQLGPDDALVDVGSGKGRVVCAAAQRNLRVIVGIEVDSSLHEAAERNLRRLRGARTPVQLQRRDAAACDFADATAICLCNPFGRETMASVLQRLHESLRLYRRRVRLAYVNPVCTHQLAAQPWLELVETWEMAPWSRIKTPVHFYRTRT